MAKVNYIAHLNDVFSRFYDDDRLNPTHISLYMALFQYWNIHRFHKSFCVSRSQVMLMSKIASKNTYSKCLRDLEKWNYIRYHPSHNPYKGSSFEIISNIGVPNNGPPLTDSVPINGLPLTDSVPNNGLPLVPSINIQTKHINERERTEQKSRSLKEIKLFFKENGYPFSVAEKFFNHYEASHWKFPNGAKIEDWKAAAKKWMIREKQLNGTGLVQKMDYLHTSNKNKYDEPL